MFSLRELKKKSSISLNYSGAGPKAGIKENFKDNHKHKHTFCKDGILFIQKCDTS